MDHTEDRRQTAFSRIARLAGASMTHWIVLLLAVIIVRARVIDDPFMLDDYTLLNKLAAPQATLGNLAFELYSFARPNDVTPWRQWWASDNLKLSYFRPLAVVLWWLEYRLGGPRAWLYHLDSLLLYAACALLMYRLASLLYGASTGLAAALIFAAAPVHLTAIQWTANRADIVSCLWLLVAYLAYANELRKERLTVASVCLIAGSYCLGLLSKESALVFPASLVLFHGFARRRWRPAAGLPQQSKTVNRRLLINLAVAGFISAAWGWFYVAKDYGVKSGYYVISTLPWKAAVVSMLKALVLYVGDLFFFIKVYEQLKDDLLGESLLAAVGLTALFLGLVILAVILMRGSALYLLGLLLLSLCPALPFWTSDRLVFMSVLWCALLIGGMLHGLTRSSWPRAAVIGLLLLGGGWFIGYGGYVSMGRAADRDVWCTKYQTGLSVQTQKLLTKNPGARVILFLNLPDPILAMSLTESLRQQTHRADLVAYPLTVFTDPPQIMVKGSRHFLLRSSTQGEFFVNFAERIFIARPRFKTGMRFTTPDFTAEIAQMDGAKVMAIDYVFVRDVTDPECLLITWSGDPPIARKYQY